MFKRSSGAHNPDYRPKKASTAMVTGNALVNDGSGFITKATSAATKIAGILMQTIATTDSDYASTTKIMLDVPTSRDVFEVDVVTGTLTTAMIGNAYDLADETGIDVTSTTHKVVTVVGFISTTKAFCKVNAVDIIAPGV